MDFFFADGAVWFSVPAILGTVVLVAQLLLGQLGGDLDVDLDLDTEAGAGDAPGAEFGWLSVQTIAAFAMGSGWMGLAALRALEVSFPVATLIALLAGLGVAWLMVTLMRSFLRLQRSDNISIDRAVGLEGSVYVMVPPSGEGRGRVTVIIDDRRREMDAVQRGGEVIPANARVRVVGADRAGNALLVEAAPSAS